MELPGRRILILYGSETGNSQEKAEEIDRMCLRLRFHTDLESMDSVKLNDLLLDYDLVCFVLSTTGQGHFPNNARKFWKNLRRAKLPPNCLASVRFTTFGLGDSSYHKYNWASRLLHSRLLRLGAQEVFPRGEADERHDDGIDSIYQPWFKDVKEYLLTTYPLPASVQPIPDEEPLPPRYTLQVVSEDMEKGAEQMLLDPTEEEERQFLANRYRSAALSHVERPMSRDEHIDAVTDRQKQFPGSDTLVRQSESSAPASFSGLRADFFDKENILKDHPEKYRLEPQPPTATSPAFPPDVLLPLPHSTSAVVMGNKRVTPEDHWQDVRLVELDVAFPVFEDHYHEPLPGDTVVIYPKNYPEDVQKLIDLMDWGEVADKKITFRTKPPDGLYPKPGCTLRELLTHNMDITAVPTRSFLHQMAFHTTHPDQKEKLFELCQSEASQEFYDFTSRPRRTILEVLNEFYSTKIPYESVPTVFPVIRGREFSIANGGRHWEKKWLGQPMDFHGRYNTAISASRIVDTLVCRFDLLVALVEYKTIIRKPRQGLCSRYIKHLPVGTPLHVEIKRSSPPPNGIEAAKRPLIAIATGTGVAPVRSLIHDRQLHLAEPAETILFFGCRNKHADYHFHAEWAATPVNVLTVVPAFSRDPKKPDPKPESPPLPHAGRPLTKDEAAGNTTDWQARRAIGLPDMTVAQQAGLRAYAYDEGKDYVQHRIRRHAAKVCELLRQNAIICLCGNSGRMPGSVREALRDAAVLGGFCKDAEAAEKLLFDEKDPGKIVYWEETW